MTPVRKKLAVAVTAVFLAAAALNATAAPVSGAPVSGETHASHHPEDLTQARLPAPPPPPQQVPTERVVTTGQLGPGATSTATSTLTDAFKTVPGAADATTGTKTLVLYDSTGPYSWLGEDYGIAAANLVSHFGAWTAHPVGSYTAGELSAYTAVVYVGSTYDEPIPVAFLDDVLASTKPVIWMYDNIWQLTARSANFSGRYGWTWKGFDFSEATTVNYKGVALTRDKLNAPSGLMDDVVTDATKATTVATAVRPDGTTLPWAMRSGKLTYIGEIPFSYIDGTDRYLAFSDLLYDALAPSTADRHRAAVRIEDVGPDADPSELRAVTDYLYRKHIPFTVAVYPRYRDPYGVNSGGVAEDYTLRQRPEVVRALKYMQSKGGTLLMHGYTHQLNALINPYNAVSGDDFEFYRAHVDTANNVIYDGPVTDDSATFANSRIVAGKNEFALAGFKTPTIFEPPHYAASATDYKVFNSAFGTRYDRGLYFSGLLSGGTVDATKPMGQYFPYSVRDVYGSAVIPENLGNIEPEPFNNHPARFPADLIAAARANLAVRDGVASFFYHPYLGTGYLKQTVEGIQGLGYTFVAGSALLS